MDLFPFAKPFLRRLPPEAAHRLTIAGLRLGLGGGAEDRDDSRLGIALWGRYFANPVGLAAGFDKDARVVDPLLRLGFGFVEVGGVTPLPQPGNPRPRVFRLPAEGAMINRLGLNNEGVEAMARRLERRRRLGPDSPAPVGVNIAPNKDSGDPVADYAACARRLFGLCDFLTVNVSSPNTPGLRSLQGAGKLRQVLASVRGACAEAEAQSGPGAGPGGGPDAGKWPAILVKIAPDLSPADREAVAAAVLDGRTEGGAEGGADGLVVANTTVTRPSGLPQHLAAETGGLSGRPLMEPATDMLRDMARLTGRRVPIIGVGGIAGGADAFAKIRAGASLVELYTALVYRGPRLIAEIKDHLSVCLAEEGFRSIAEAVGADLA